MNNISTEQLATLINTELQKDKNISVNKLCDKVGIKRSTFKSKMKRGNYVFDEKLRKYVKEDITHNITSDRVIDYNKLNLLLDNIDLLLELVKKKDVTHNITIDNKENTVKSLRINKVLYEKIKEKSIKENVSISSIVNKALLDYLNNYI